MFATTTNYRENRASIPVGELEKHDRQWVAFSSDGNRIVAGAGELKDLVAQLRTAGCDPQQVVFERIEFDDCETFVGGAEAS